MAWTVRWFVARGVVRGRNDVGPWLHAIPSDAARRDSPPACRNSALLTRTRRVYIPRQLFDCRDVGVRVRACLTAAFPLFAFCTAFLIAYSIFSQLTRAFSLLLCSAATAPRFAPRHGLSPLSIASYLRATGIVRIHRYRLWLVRCGLNGALGSLDGFNMVLHTHCRTHHHGQKQPVGQATWWWADGGDGWLCFLSSVQCG